MAEKSCYKKIKEHILSEKLNTIFAIADFRAFGSPTAVRKALSRLVKEDICKRVRRGIYYRPSYSTLFQAYNPPDPCETAIALAKNNNWKIVPSPIIAQNLIGLSLQVPAEIHYTSTGPSHEYQLGGFTIKFTHSNEDYMKYASEDSALIMNAFQGLQNFEITEAELNRVSYKMPENMKISLFHERELAPQWMLPYIEKICKKKER